MPQVSKRKAKKAEGQARIQTKAFTKWANSHLKSKGIKMDDITKELSSGLNLCYLLSSMTGEKVIPPNSPRKVQLSSNKNVKTDVFLKAFKIICTSNTYNMHEAWNSLLLKLCIPYQYLLRTTLHCSS